jgi:hypothetical protein
MGLTIHYKGALTDKRAIERLIDEVEDIAKSMGWDYSILDEDWGIPPDIELSYHLPGSISLEGHSGLKGISFQPHPQCETVSLFFNASCILTSPWSVAISAMEGYPAKADWQSVKTQFAGPETHVAIIHLLRYMQGKYLHDLEVLDEGEYWESSDFEMLNAKMRILDQALNQIEEQLSTLESSGRGDIVERIERVLRDMRRNQGED